jgi:hypothetical protein
MPDYIFSSTVVGERLARLWDKAMSAEGGIRALLEPYSASLRQIFVGAAAALAGSVLQIILSLVASGGDQWQWRTNSHRQKARRILPPRPVPRSSSSAPSCFCFSGVCFLASWRCYCPSPRRSRGGGVLGQRRRLGGEAARLPPKALR